MKQGWGWRSGTWGGGRVKQGGGVRVEQDWARWVEKKPRVGFNIGGAARGRCPPGRRPSVGSIHSLISPPHSPSITPSPPLPLFFE